MAYANGNAKSWKIIWALLHRKRALIHQAVGPPTVRPGDVE